MFYKLIEKKRNEWLASPECTVTSLLSYIEQRGMMRDAQTEAIKTYLFLKIACQNLPLWQLFCEGWFNDTVLDAEELTVETRDVLTSNTAALALFQYSRLKDKNGKQLAPQLESYIRHHACEIDYEQTFRDIFYGVSYSDYLFSLPMGAGKTFLMAAFIYIDLYFADQEPQNPIWAHNFLILAPSGLKSSIIPSLKSINLFDPSWIFPAETAENLRRIRHFMVLDEPRTAKNSNQVKNPNAQKLNFELRDGDAMGLVVVTNAEKVILDRVDSDPDPKLYQTEEEKRELKKIEVANELRSIVGKIPNLAIFIDEVQHASKDEIKLRKVVTQWAQDNRSFAGVLGFSGTPFQNETIRIGNGFDIKSTDISNVVFFYPLIDGIDNFLKRPTVKSADADSLEILRSGIREFMDSYRDTVYSNGTCAKLAIYCGLIPTLEEVFYPVVAEIVSEYGLNPAQVILKRHKGNNPKKGETRYPEPEGSEAAFNMLDTPMSNVRIVMLVQIGKEGWDCKSLTGVILPHEGACPKTMVLQTSCRCLRQTERGAHESALIWLNKWNADKLNQELKQKQNITLSEFSDKPKKPRTTFNRYVRMNEQQLPSFDFYQLKVEYQTFRLEEKPDVYARLTDSSLLVKAEDTLVGIQDMEGNILDWQILAKEQGEEITYPNWLWQICKESFGTLSMSELRTYDAELSQIFNQITICTDGVTTYSAIYDQQQIRSLIRQAFVPRRDYRITEEVIPDKASLLAIHNVKPTFEAADESRVYPTAEAVNEILDWDAHPDKGGIPADVKAAIELMRSNGMNAQADLIEANTKREEDPHPERHQTYQYLPYHFASLLEVQYFRECLIAALRSCNLEYYFNGDNQLSDFKIRCYKQKGGHWQYDGLYVPDFLVLSRDAEGQIDRICIIETKGEGYDPKFADRKEFMQNTFVDRNNKELGRNRFRFLYIPDTDKPEQRVLKTKQMIKEFFNA